jgi:hypothetical protein
MSKNGVEAYQLEQFIALLTTGSEMTDISVRLQEAGIAVAQARVGGLRDWVIRECECLQPGAYRELARRIKQRPARKSAMQR